MRIRSISRSFKGKRHPRAEDLGWCQRMLDVDHLFGIGNKELANSDNGYEQTPFCLGIFRLVEVGRVIHCFLI